MLLLIWWVVLRLCFISTNPPMIRVSVYLEIYIDHSYRGKNIQVQTRSPRIINTNIPFSEHVKFPLYGRRTLGE